MASNQTTQTEQTVTLAGPPLSQRHTFQEHNGDKAGPAMNRDYYWLQVADGPALDVNLAVAQEAARLCNAGHKQVVVTVEGGLGVAIKSA